MKFEKPICESEKFTAVDIITSSSEVTEPTKPTSDPKSDDPFGYDKF